MIAPTNAASVTLRFTAFNTESGFDWVYVDTCRDTTCAVPLSTVQLSGAALPADVKTTTGIMRVRFRSDSTRQKDGFVAVYTGGSVYDCKSSDAVIQTPMAVVSDGTGQYANALACAWLFAPAAASGARVQFLQFNTEAGRDFVHVDHCSKRRSDGLLTAAGNVDSMTSKVPETITTDAAWRTGDEGWLQHAWQEGEAIWKASAHVANALMHMNDGHQQARS